MKIKLFPLLILTALLIGCAGKYVNVDNPIARAGNKVAAETGNQDTASQGAMARENVQQIIQQNIDVTQSIQQATEQSIVPPSS